MCIILKRRNARPRENKRVRREREEREEKKKRCRGRAYTQEFCAISRSLSLSSAAVGRRCAPARPPRPLLHRPPPSTPQTAHRGGGEEGRGVRKRGRNRVGCQRNRLTAIASVGQQRLRVAQRVGVRNHLREGGGARHGSGCVREREETAGEEGDRGGREGSERERPTVTMADAAEGCSEGAEEGEGQRTGRGCLLRLAAQLWLLAAGEKARERKQ